MKEQRRQMEAIERMPKTNTNGRGTLIPGLWAARTMEGVSQRELAEMAGTSQGTVQQLEAQRRGAYPKTLRKLSKALGVPPADLIREQTSYEKERVIMPTTTRYMDDGTFTICKLYYYDNSEDMEEFEQLMTSPETPVHSVSYHDEYVQVIIIPEW